MGDIIELKCIMNLLGLGHFVMAFTLLRSTKMGQQRYLRRCNEPKEESLGCKTHFFRLTKSFRLAKGFACVRIRKSCLRCSMHCSLGLLYTKMSPKYATKNYPKNGWKTWVMSLINVLGALDDPKGITVHSNRPSWLFFDFYVTQRKCIFVF